MAAKERTLPLLIAAASLLATSSVFASIPKSKILTSPSIDLRYQVASPPSVPDDNDTLLARELARALPSSAPLTSLAETRVRAFGDLAPFEHQEASGLNHALRKASANSWTEIAADSTFAGGDPVNGRDPQGMSGDQDELRRLVKLLDEAKDEAARLNGLNSYADVLKHGDKGEAVDQALTKLLAPGSKYYDPRIVTQMEVGNNGRILFTGLRRKAAKGALVKDVVILRPGVAADELYGQVAKDVTLVVEDLKLGKTGARYSQTATKELFGVPSAVMKPFRDILEGRSKGTKLLREMLDEGGAKIISTTFIAWQTWETYQFLKKGNPDSAAEAAWLPAAVLHGTATWSGGTAWNGLTKFLHGIGPTPAQPSRSPQTRQDQSKLENELGAN